MTIGLSLPLKYLIRAEETAGTKCFADAFGNPNDCLAELRCHGIGSIELNDINSGTRGEDVLRAAKSVTSAGMFFTLHGYLPAKTQSSLLDMLVPVGDFLKGRHAGTVMVVHAHADSGMRGTDLVESTARALGQLADGIHRRDLPIKTALEISRYHGVDTPGATYDGLLKITMRLARPDVGFCWDMGHTRSSVLQNKLPPVPPPAFVASVIHTHVHDLAPDGTTHWPLTEFSPYIVSCMSRLEDSGYAGIYNLELYPARWTAQQKVRHEILGSVRRLMAIRRRINGGHERDDHCFCREEVK